MKNKTLTVIAALALAVGVAIGAASPASAATGNKVKNTGTLTVQVSTANGFVATLYTGDSLSQVIGLYVPPNKCVRYKKSTWTKKCATANSYFVVLPTSGVTEVQRLS